MSSAPVSALRSAVPLSAEQPRPGCPSARPWPGQSASPQPVLIAPPYETTLLLRDSSAAERQLPFGSVIALSMPGPRVEWAPLEAMLQQFRSRHPGCPVVLLIDPGTDDLLYTIARASKLPFRAVLLRGAPTAAVLRRQLCQPLCLADDVVEWLGLRGIRMSPALAHLIRQIIARAPHHSELFSLCREIGLVESSARFRCQKKGLPAPSRWLHLARALHAALRLQAEPERPLLSLALELGYADHSALSHQIQRAFGMRPGVVRGVVGWEGLMSRWLDSNTARGRNPVMGAAVARGGDRPGNSTRC